MGFELPDGKTARNIQEQVKFLTEKLKDLYAAVNGLGLKKIEIVEELPEVGNVSTLYLLLRDDPETGNYYEEYLWLDNQWELIGTTEIDLSGYVTLDTAQTITGTKTFTTGIFFDENNNITPSGYNMIFDSGGDFIYKGTIRPSSDNARNLGAASRSWKDLYLSGKVYLEGVASYIQFDSGLLLYSSNSFTRTNSTFYPTSDNLYDLGNASRHWKDLYLSGKLYIRSNQYLESNSSGSVTLSSDTNNTFYFGTRIFRAVSNNLYDLGSSSVKWKDLYLAGNLSDGTNTVSVAEIGKVKTVNGNAPDASGNIAVATGTGLYLHTLTFSTGPANPIFLINNVASAYTTRALLASAMAGSNCCCKLSTGQSIIQVDDTITKTTLYYLNGSLGITSVDITNSDTFTDTVTPYQQ